jgi:ubiquinone/menaquinone biosynthesis C-methylase UbiE
LDHREVGRIWDGNAEAWTELAREGFDLYRDEVNTPAFLAMLPEVSDLHGLDVGCGEGHNTRLVAQRSARVEAIDISPYFVAAAMEEERREPLGIRYQVASAVELPFRDASFDFVVSTMALMDVPEHDRALAEAHRVLKPGGFFQFSMTHPCFLTPRWEWVEDHDHERTGVICGEYFDQPQGTVEQWTFGAVPLERRAAYPPFQVPRFPRTLSEWINLIVASGFVFEQAEEPRADEETAERCPDVSDTRIVAQFLHLRCRKSA